jgi:hypothetical protein
MKFRNSWKPLPEEVATSIFPINPDGLGHLWTVLLAAVSIRSRNIGTSDSRLL